MGLTLFSATSMNRAPRRHRPVSRLTVAVVSGRRSPATRGSEKSMSPTVDVGELLDEYQLWVEQVLDTRDAVRNAYESGAYSRQFIDRVCAKVIVDLFKQPDTFRSSGLPYSTRISNLVRPFLTGERPPPSTNACGVLASHRDLSETVPRPCASSRSVRLRSWRRCRRHGEPDRLEPSPGAPTPRRGRRVPPQDRHRRVHSSQ